MIYLGGMKTDLTVVILCAVYNLKIIFVRSALLIKEIQAALSAATGE
jgi:hypothetical protein